MAKVTSTLYASLARHYDSFDATAPAVGRDLRVSLAVWHCSSSIQTLYNITICSRRVPLPVYMIVCHGGANAVVTVTVFHVA
jgi:hypothetical protein